MSPTSSHILGFNTTSHKTEYLKLKKNQCC